MARLKVKNPETGEWFYADLAIQDDTTKESVSNKVTSLSSSSTDTEYPTAKCVYDFTQASRSRLPSEYQEVEYLESDGNQWVDTGYVPKLTTVWNLVTRFKGQGDSDATMRHGRHGGGTGERFSIGAQGMTNTNPSIELAIGNVTLGSANWGVSRLYETSMDAWLFAPTKWAEANNRYYCVDYSSATLTFANTDSLYLFRRHLVNDGFDSAGTSKVYSHRIWENKVLIQDFVPCYRKSDNEAGFYDLISKTFFTNQGTGSFITGLEM